MLADMGTMSDPEPGFDRTLLEDILGMLHDYLDHKVIRLQPAQEAELIAAVYDYMIKSRRPKKDRQRTLGLVGMLIDEKDTEP